MAPVSWRTFTGSASDSKQGVYLPHPTRGSSEEHTDDRREEGYVHSADIGVEPGAGFSILLRCDLVILMYVFQDHYPEEENVDLYPSAREIGRYDDRRHDPPDRADECDTEKDIT